ncbi:hypothetical protein EYS09_26200 [Streptomyces kasugaensis]|uniref:Phage portal protein n=1 Tax=Streptomyces kasugaensis TaxID=1946 RepID=A0A4Q9HQM7_STRKA|nr:hypothetical protein [Streptomyces kasugaensis]TBO56769.1 hypothetical protein EYS09_26200 [Streptomyces kasugaensis]
MAWWKIHKRDGSNRTSNGATLLASASIVTRAQVRSVVGRKQEWQSQGWDFYRTVPELKSGVRWAANGCSRTRLYVGRIDPDGSSRPTPVQAEGDDDTSPELAAKLLAPLQEFAGGQSGQSEMLRRLSVHLDVPGESYIVGFDDPETSERRWIVCSPSEVTSAKGGDAIRVQLPESQTARLELPLHECTLLRLWRPDDEYAYLPDSPLQGLQEPLRELQGLSAHVLATVDSRLKGAGLGLISDDVVPASPQESTGANPIHSDPVTAAWVEAAAASLRNRDSAAALVPLMLRVPGSVEDKFKWIEFAAQLDKEVLPLREGATKRVAIGLDMPPEVLTGLADTNHWNAWAISDDAIKLHHEPKLGLICDAFTTQHFRAVWGALGVPDPENWACWYDTSDLKQRPNRAPEAAEAHSRGVLSDAAYLRELGFSSEDMPDDEEQRRRLLLQLATTNAQLAPAALSALGVQIPEAAQEVATDADRAPVEISRSAPAPELPRNGPPQLPGASGVTASAAAAEAEEWRISCLDMAVRRALERAGQWLLNRGGRSMRGQFREVPLHQIHVQLGTEQENLDQMLTGAYQLLHDAVPDEPCLHRAVDHYVRALLLAREEHHRGYLARALAQAGCDGQAA